MHVINIPVNTLKAVQMKRPEKKQILGNVGFNSDVYLEGYNQACDHWEKFLPSEDEIEDLLLPGWDLDFEMMVKAIHERLRGEPTRED